MSKEFYAALRGNQVAMMFGDRARRHRLDEAWLCLQFQNHECAKLAQQTIHSLDEVPASFSFASTEIARLQAQVDALAGALQAIRQYGSDTLSGRTDGPDDRAWQRAAVREMTKRASAALAAAGR